MKEGVTLLLLTIFTLVLGMVVLTSKSSQNISLLMDAILNPWIIGASFGLVVFTIALLRLVYRPNNEQDELIFADMFVRAHEACEIRSPDHIKSVNYFNVNKLLMENPALAEKASSLFANILRRYPGTKVCFVEKNFGSGGVLTISGAIEVKLEKPVSKISLIRDVMTMAIGGASINPGDKVAIVQDVLRTGTQTMQAVRKLERFGAKVVAVVSLIDCEVPDRDYELRTMEVDLVSILRLSEIQNRKKITCGLKNRQSKELHLPIRD